MCADLTGQPIAALDNDNQDFRGIALPRVMASGRRQVWQQRRLTVVCPNHALRQREKACRFLRAKEKTRTL